MSIQAKGAKHLMCITINMFCLHDVTNVYDTSVRYTGVPATHGITCSHAFGNMLSR
jgi:hypothetical protein